MDEFEMRCAEAEQIIRIGFRLDFPEPEYEECQAVVDWAADKAYSMLEKIEKDRVTNPFGWLVPPFSDNKKRKDFFRRNAVAQVYCQMREIIGEINGVNAYTAAEYTYFGSEEKSSGKGVISGMDYLLSSRDSSGECVYKFKGNTHILERKQEILAVNRRAILSKSNSALRLSSIKVDGDLHVMPRYKSFFQENSDQENEKKFKSSDLDVAAIYRKYSKKLENLAVLKMAADDKIHAEENKKPRVLTIKEIEKWVKNYEMLTDLSREEKLTAADKLYIKMRIEQALSVDLLMCLWGNLMKINEAFFLTDEDAIRRLSSCYRLENIINRTDVINAAFSSLISMRKQNRLCNTWEKDIVNDMEGNEVTRLDTPFDNKEWLGLFEDGIDFISDWAIPLYNTFFCINLRNCVKKWHDKSEGWPLYKIIADYINRKNIEIGYVEGKEKMIEELRYNQNMVRVLSDYITNLFVELPEEIKTPITLKEFNCISPKDTTGTYLNLLKLQCARRINAIGKMTTK